MKKKLLVVSLCAIIAIMAIAGSSLAWLKDETGTVVNTFTEGKVDIDLYETKDSNKVMANSYKMIPGNTLTKDPTVEVLAVSEACWLFVKIEKTANFDESRITISQFTFISRMEISSALTLSSSFFKKIIYSLTRLNPSIFSAVNL